MKVSTKIFSLLVAVCAGSLAVAQTPTNDPKASSILLPNGWSLSPAGHSMPLGDLPVNSQLSPSEKLMAVTNNGQSRHSIQLIDPQSEKLLYDQEIGKAWYGLKFSDDEKKLYVSGGNDNFILVYPIKDQKLGKADTIRLGKPWPQEKICPGGVEVNDATQTLYTVTKNDNALYVVDLKTGKTTKRVDLQHEVYACLLSPNKRQLYISLWGGDELLVFDTQTQTIVSRIKTQSHPNEILQTRNGRYVFVANANDNSVSVIDSRTNKVIEIIATTLYPTHLIGSTTNGLALSPDEKTLYAANADNNCLAVFDVSIPGKSFSRGFIPVGWYPTNVKTIGRKILVMNGKGFTSMPNPQGPQPIKKTDNSELHVGISNQPVQYIGGLFKGTLSFIDVPDQTKLKAYTKQVYANTPFNPTKQKNEKVEAGNPILMKAGEKSPIKYVFYVIKENRTYDQMLGDLPQGNGDSTLCLFNRKITPNHHALAEEFVLLDNFYVDGEVSADGHIWTNGAYSTDFTEKTWPASYGRRGGNGPNSEKINSPHNGFLWDYCQRAGLSYRSYGEYANYGKARVRVLDGHMCNASPSFNHEIRDTTRVQIWKHDFDSLLVAGAVPRFNTLLLPNDHTSGQLKGSYSPFAAVADNDLALGMLVDHISHSPIWKESVIFVLEDDAQNGPDHVDAHRSVAYAISAYTKRRSVNHHMYSTSGMVRTIELILGLPPMSQYDAAALPMYDCFTSQPDLTPYTHKPAQVDLGARNTAWNKSAERSGQFNFAQEDAAPDLELNDIIWKAVKGEASVMPAPRRSAFVILDKRKDDD
jgi:YVTN family beta-propeller protein